MDANKNNICLIGMAGAGKSTIGPALSNLTGRSFIDVDELIEKTYGLPLQKMLDSLGGSGFRALEEQVLLDIDCEHHVIATGGSAIYSSQGMEHLKRSSLLVFLDVELPVLMSRVGDFSTRGLVKTREQGFAELFGERLPLYRKYADIIIACGENSVAELCLSIRDQISDTFYHL